MPETVWLTSADPEPDVGAIVETTAGERWVRDDDLVIAWFHEGHEDDDPESWIKVAGNYGPVRVVAVVDEDGTERS